MRVPCSSWLFRNLVCGQSIEMVSRVRTFNENLAHMTHIKQSRTPAHRQMLLHNPRELERHLPAAKLNESRIGSCMCTVKRGPQGHSPPENGAGRKALCPRGLEWGNLFVRSHLRRAPWRRPESCGSY